MLLEIDMALDSSGVISSLDCSKSPTHPSKYVSKQTTENQAPAVVEKRSLFDALFGDDSRATVFFEEDGSVGYCNEAGSRMLAEHALTEDATSYHEFEEVLGAPPISDVLASSGCLSRWSRPDGKCALHSTYKRLECGDTSGVLVTLEPQERSLERATLYALLDKLELGIIVADSRKQVRYYNRVAQQITRRESWVSLHEQRPYKLITVRGEELGAENGPITRALETGREIQDEILLFDFGVGGVVRVIVDVCHLTAPNDPDPLFMVVLRDVTQRHAREQKKGEFLSVVSHELRNPMTPLRGLLQIAISQQQSGQDIPVALLPKALSQVERLTRLVDGLLDVSRFETGKFSFTKQRTDLTHLIDELASSWVSRHGAERFALTLPHAPLFLDIDAAGIEQVLNNLLDNALKFSDEDSVIELSLESDTEHATLTVCDQGVGIDADELERIIEQFYQSSEGLGASGSLGLGLYISHKIVTEHRGKITFSSVRGEWTRVEVCLPLG